jgi:hypothetical protein
MWGIEHMNDIKNLGYPPNLGSVTYLQNIYNVHTTEENNTCIHMHSI